jgi:hypothetical protein
VLPAGKVAVLLGLEPGLAGLVLEDVEALRLSDCDELGRGPRSRSVCRGYFGSLV